MSDSECPEWGWIVPAGLWEAARPLLPRARTRPQGGGTANTPDAVVFAAVVYVLVSGCAWRALPPCFGLSKSTAHRRFLAWSRAGVWARLHRAVPGAGLPLVLLDAARERAAAGANLRTRTPWPGPGPVRRCAPCPLGGRACPSAPEGPQAASSDVR
ncbi:hypothetical protein SRB5_21170 [Streptomyces sp. RB5]|uniref:Insertion element IS402-like domain-containing protein n=1 Tax=Streptomyces smaragdinus TaxID=2585196 RepID=A0A7K0CET9_9ACTN|nr:hypothetical protein [Streptomyces smaragdinus]